MQARRSSQQRELRETAGGGRASARETIGRVAAGALAKKVLRLFSGVEIVGYVHSVQDITAENKIDPDAVTQEMVQNCVQTVLIGIRLEYFVFYSIFRLKRILCDVLTQLQRKK